MPNRLELDIAKDAVKAVLETHAGKNAAAALAHLGDEGGKLLAKHLLWRHLYGPSNSMTGQVVSN